jgi:hypothetical protein
MIVNILMVIAIALIVLSLCTLFETSLKARLFNLVVNTALMAVMMTKNIITGSYGFAGLFGALLVLNLVLIVFVLRLVKKENPFDKVVEHSVRDKFLNDIKKKYGSTRH